MSDPLPLSDGRLRYGDEQSLTMADALGGSVADGAEEQPVYIGRDAETCHDCGAERGEHHAMGCDVEQCPTCGRQLIGCEHASSFLVERDSE